MRVPGARLQQSRNVFVANPFVWCVAFKAIPVETNILYIDIADKLQSGWEKAAQLWITERNRIVCPHHFARRGASVGIQPGWNVDGNRSPRQLIYLTNS